jgi:hypothetical protein
MKILQVKDFKQFEIEKVQAFMKWELKNLAFNFDYYEKLLPSNS